jgi:hypothetical protein
MTTRGPGQLIAGAGGIALIVSLFLPWASAGGVDRSGFELWTMADVYLLIVGIAAIATAVTGGRIGVFRPDVSLNGAADLLSVVATVMLAWLVLFDFPSDAGREIGVYLGLISAIVIAAGVGDYSTLRGAPVLPRLDRGDKASPTASSSTSSWPRSSWDGMPSAAACFLASFRSCLACRFSTSLRSRFSLAMVVLRFPLEAIPILHLCARRDAEDAATQRQRKRGALLRLERMPGRTDQSRA